MKLVIAAFVVLLQLSNSYADARLIIHLTDYLANDYAGAVSEESKVLSEVEYAEQVEFGQTALKEGQADLKLNQNSDLMKQLNSLSEAINSKKGPSVVVPLAREIQKSVILISGIALSPTSWPDYDKARKLFQSHCIQCHGTDGRGDGPDARGLDPAPANFHDMSRAPIVSPFAAFNTIRLGVPGTGMLAFSRLSDEQIWSLAFYVSSMRFGKPVRSREVLSDKISNEELLDKAASSTDEDLKNFLVSKGESEDMLKDVRLYFYESESSDYLTKAQEFLSESVKAFKNGNIAGAEKLSLDAYFLGIEPVENKISVNDPSAVTRIEEKMAAFRKSIKTQDANGLEIAHQSLQQEIKSLHTLLGGHTVTPGFAFVSGFSIILREGFEAVLVILAILGVAKAAGSTVVTAAVHSGWVISLILGVIGWFVSGYLISLSGVSREIMEAVAAFFAVFVLIYVGFWMHRQTEMHRWKEFINVKVKNLTETKNLLGLFILSFVVTFREVIETVLFLRTVYIDTGSDIRMYILYGVLVAFAIVLVVSVMITKFRNKVPLQKFFNLSSVLMMMLATILAGKGVHALQEAAVVGMTVFPVKVRIELLGVFPSWETITAQLIVLIVSILIWKNAWKKN